MRVLGIETSCDETGVAVYDTDRGLLAHALHSQVAMHRDYGGVVPELASRDHVRRVVPLVRQVVADAGLDLADLDGIAYTQGPGLAGALLVGASVATALGFALRVPVVPVHHLEGHLLSPLLADPRPDFPFVALLVSGGHSQLFDVTGVGDYRLLGDTQDDAAGEAFDKVARLVGLPYPGGPSVQKAAAEGNPTAFDFPRSRLDGTWNFSFSGLKTAVLRVVRKLQEEGRVLPVNDLAASFQAAAVDVLFSKAMKAAREYNVKAIVVAGGVSANRALRDAFLNQKEFPVHIPPLSLCTDNAAMIGAAAYFGAQAGRARGDGLALDVIPSLSLE